MLKMRKKDYLSIFDYKILKRIYCFFIECDNFLNTSYSKEYYYIYIDKKSYSLYDIELLTGNSESTLRRKIQLFDGVILKQLQLNF